ncbi:MAG: diguanylate cyclase [Raoultibacter sp.]
MKTDPSAGVPHFPPVRKTEEFVEVSLAADGCAVLKKNLDQSNALIRMLSFCEDGTQIDRSLRVARIGIKSNFNDEWCTFYRISDSLCALLGYTYDEFMEMSGGTAAGAVYPPDLPGAMSVCKRCFEHGNEYHTEYRIQKKDGTLLWVTDSGYKTLAENGDEVVFGVVVDISEDKEMLERLRIERERYEIVAELSDDIIYEYDVRKDTLEVFSSKLEIFEGLPSKKGVFNFFLRDYIPEGKLIFPEDKPLFIADLTRMVEGGEAGASHCFEYRLRLQSNRSELFFDESQYTPCRILVRRIFDGDNKVVKLVGKALDISSESLLRYQSSTDSLTGAYNRSYFRKEIEAYGQAKSPDLLFAVLLFDVDFFKTVNDAYGHVAGDQMLVELVNLSRQLFRRTDIIARLGGDEFVVLMRDIYDEQIVREKTEMLLVHFKRFAEDAGYPDAISLSVGVVITDENNATFSQLYQQADIALYNAKARGKDRAVLYEANMTHPVFTYDDAFSRQVNEVVRFDD